MSGRPPDDSPQRHEPRLGDLDRLGAEEPAGAPDDGLPQVTISASDLPPSLRPRRRRRRWLIWLLGLFLLLGLGLWSNQDRIRSWIPSTALNQLLNRADQALAQGRLDGHDGSSARELYQAAVALQPDDDRAQNGLQAVTQAELTRGWQDLQAGRLAAAASALQAARQIAGGGQQLDDLAHALDEQQVSGERLGNLLEQAQQALGAGRIEGEQGAGMLYRQALRAAPGNAIAQHGLDEVGATLAGQARQMLAGNDPHRAGELIDQLSVVAPNYVDLPGLKAQLAELRRQQDSGLAALLTQGRAALREGRLTGPGKDNALAAFRAAQAIDPGNVEAKSGLGQVSLALIIQAETALDHGDADTAEYLLDQASALSPQSTQLAATRARLPAAEPVKAQSSHAPIGSSTSAAPAASASLPAEPAEPGSAALSPKLKARLSTLLQEARNAARRGAILLPPGGSAYDLYRNALAIDGRNSAALAGLKTLPDMVAQHFQQALASDRLAQAAAQLATLAELLPGDASLGPLREALANAWLDSAGRAIDSGDTSLAGQALGQAGRLSPGNPRLQELYVRLHRL